jgi:hypothetical protein
MSVEGEWFRRGEHLRGDSLLYSQSLAQYIPSIRWKYFAAGGCEEMDVLLKGALYTIPYYYSLDYSCRRQRFHSECLIKHSFLNRNALTV